MRVLRTTDQLHERGWTRPYIRKGERQGRWTRVVRGVYGVGGEPPSALDIARATALATNGIAAETFAGVLLGYDGVELGEWHVLVAAGTSNDRPGVRRVRELPLATLDVGQVRCTDGATTLLALARTPDDIAWEQALESALRLGLARPEDVADMAIGTTRSAARVRRVLRSRGGVDVAPTESLLETLMVQLARLVPGLPPPERQVEIYDEHGIFVARVDLAWPSLGIFIELDGQQHANQPTYDASRQTRVAAVTGWLCGRFTWDQVTRTPTACRRQLAALVAQAGRRPLIVR